MARFLRGSAEIAKQCIRRIRKTPEDTTQLLKRFPWLQNCLSQQGKTIAYFTRRVNKEDTSRKNRSNDEAWQRCTEYLKNHIAITQPTYVTEDQLLTFSKDAGFYMTENGKFELHISSNAFGCVYVATLLINSKRLTKVGETGNVTQRNKGWLTSEEKRAGATVIEINHLHKIPLKSIRREIENATLDLIKIITPPIRGKETFDQLLMSTSTAIAILENICGTKKLGSTLEDIREMNSLKNEINERLNNPRRSRVNAHNLCT